MKHDHLIRKKSFVRSISVILTMLLMLVSFCGSVASSFADEIPDCSIRLFSVTEESNKIIGMASGYNEISIYINETPVEEKVVLSASGLFTISINPQAVGTKVEVKAVFKENKNIVKATTKTIYVTEKKALGVAGGSGNNVEVSEKNLDEPATPKVVDQEMEEVFFEEDLVIVDEPVPVGPNRYFKEYLQVYKNRTTIRQSLASRGEAAVLFACILQTDLEKAKNSDQKFKDLSSDRLEYGYVQSLGSIGLLGGYGDNTFKAAKGITHSEMAVMISRYLGLIGAEVSTEDAGVDDISGIWAEDAINQMYNAGVLIVEDTPNFNPHEPTTRDEFVKWIDKLMKTAVTWDKPPAFKELGLNEGSAPETGYTY